MFWCPHAGPQHGNDDTVIQVTSDVTESMLRQKRVDDDTKTYTPDIPGSHAGIISSHHYLSLPWNKNYNYKSS